MLNRILWKPEQDEYDLGPIYGLVGALALTTAFLAGGCCAFGAVLVWAYLL